MNNRAIVQDAYGSADLLELRDIDAPQIARERCWCASTRPAWIGASGM
jgi:hypothetical protein